MQEQLLLPAPDKGRELYLALEAARDAYQEKKCFSTYVQVQKCIQDYNEYYASKRSKFTIMPPASMR